MAILRSIPAQDQARCFDEWFIRMRRCLENDGDWSECRNHEQSDRSVNFRLEKLIGVR